MKGLSLISALIFIVILLTSCSVSTAKVTEITPCTNVDEYGKPIDAKDTFSTSDLTMYVSATTSNVPEDTTVKILWKYSDGVETKTVDTLEVELDDSRYIQSHLSAESGFPIGTYTVEFYVDDREAPDKVATITVK